MKGCSDYLGYLGYLGVTGEVVCYMCVRACLRACKQVSGACVHMSNDVGVGRPCDLGVAQRHVDGVAAGAGPSGEAAGVVLFMLLVFTSTLPPNRAHVTHVTPP